MFDAKNFGANQEQPETSWLAFVVFDVERST